MPEETNVVDIDAGTVARELTPASNPSASETALPSLRAFTEETGDLSNRARLVKADVDDLHQNAIMHEWQKKSSDLVRQDIPSLLNRLADLGFAWRDVARLIGVSVPAVQKWRRGGPSTGASRLSAAAILATCDLIQEHYLVQDVASWFEAPVVFSYPVTALDLYAAKRVQLVFRLASGKADPEQVMSAFDPEWRDKYRSEFEVFEAEDGLAIRPKAR
jgi:hypothetical protein